MIVDTGNEVTSAADDDDWGLDEENKILTLKELCLVKNKQGETPLHLAAMAGNQLSEFHPSTLPKIS